MSEQTSGGEGGKKKVILLQASRTLGLNYQSQLQGVNEAGLIWSLRFHGLKLIVAKNACILLYGELAM